MRSPVVLVLLLAACTSSNAPAGAGDGGGADGGEAETAPWDATRTDGAAGDLPTGDAADVVEVGGNGAPSALRCTEAELAANDKSTIPGQVQIFASSRPEPMPVGWRPPQYRQPCITIKAGQSIDFRGDFSLYPLEPFGGDTPNPIPSVANLPALNGVVPQVRVNFPSRGVFGYQCATYPADMFGAVRVIP